METIEFIIGIIVGTPLMILGFGIFITIWFYSFKWLFVGLVRIALRGGLLSFYFMIYLFIVIAKKMGF